MIDQIASNLDDGASVLIGAVGTADSNHELLFTAHHLTAWCVDQAIIKDAAVRPAREVWSECQRRASL